MPIKHRRLDSFCPAFFLLVVSNALIDFLDLFFIKMIGDQPDDHVNEGEFDNEWEVKSESCWKPAGQGS